MILSLLTTFPFILDNFYVQADTSNSTPAPQFSYAFDFDDVIDMSATHSGTDITDPSVTSENLIW